ncbi:MAG: M28 family peptidase [Phycisphaerae bacterium]|nr:M28 family peptidase [Saprospiraceae bacterium]
MKRFSLLFIYCFCFCHAGSLLAQTNILSTTPLAEQILLSNYNPTDYAPASATPLLPTELAAQLQAHISPDSLKAYIIRLSEFGTRNSGSDTVSANEGIGAARRWTHQKFSEFSAANDGRLIPSYLQFDLSICGAGQHKNIFAVLPGSNPTSGVVLVEGHIDTRCDTLCDVTCRAEGVEDNATGTALVLELARVMSRYQFTNTIIFLVTIAEEQGLLGADAFADYVQQKYIPLRAVLNNDVIGGILCGKTSSPPSCPGLNDVDSTSVRLFSFGGNNSKYKQLARFNKLQYQENVLPFAQVPMTVRIMSAEDRSGRGGDHIPFREHNYASMRFTSANEHGDASNGPNYTDRQHTSDDVLGVDTNGDGEVDSFFVDFNYLARNTLINANALAIAARSVALPPNFTAFRVGSDLTVYFDSPIDTHTIRIAVRNLATLDWDTVYTISPGFSTVMTCSPTLSTYISVAGVDEWGAESLFSEEKLVKSHASGTGEPGSAEPEPNFRLFQNRPNPFDEATWISFWVNEVPPDTHSAFMQISDLQGRVVQNMPVTLQQGMNEVLYTHGFGVRGTFTYALWVGGKAVDARQMIFAN